MFIARTGNISYLIGDSRTSCFPSGSRCRERAKELGVTAASPSKSWGPQLSLGTVFSHGANVGAEETGPLIAGESCSFGGRMGDVSPGDRPESSDRDPPASFLRYERCRRASGPPGGGEV